MTEFNFLLSEKNFDRVDAIKQIRGKKDATFNDMAQELLEEYLYQLFPSTPKMNEDGELLNPEDYRG